MSNPILQITFNYDCSEAELKTTFAHAAAAIAHFPSLNWKIWIINDQIKAAGGVYCFDDETALVNYINSPIVAAIRANPALSNLQVTPFAAIAALTAQTRGPVPLPQNPLAV